MSEGAGIDQRLTTHPSDDRYPAWSPDGTRLAFSSGRAGSMNLHVLDLATRVITQITHLSGRTAFPSWAPCGETIAFTLETDSGIHLFSISADGSDLRQLTSHPTRDVWPRWSPAGEYIAFFSRRGTAGREDDLYLLEPSSGRVTALTSGPGNEFCPAWSPEGRLLAAAYVSSQGARSLRIHDLTGALVGTPVADMTRITEPDWSPNGRTIAFAGRRDAEYDVYIVTLPP